MRLTYDLTLEQTQKLIMTPELRLAIELLQFNTLELQEYIAKELEENPILEITSTIEEYEDLEKYTKDEIDWKEYFEHYDDYSYKQEVDRNVEEFNFESYISYEPTLRNFY